MTPFNFSITSGSLKMHCTRLCFVYIHNCLTIPNQQLQKIHATIKDVSKAIEGVRGSRLKLLAQEFGENPGTSPLLP